MINLGLIRTRGPGDLAQVPSPGSGRSWCADDPVCVVRSALCIFDSHLRLLTERRPTMNPLTGEDYDLILESLRYTKEAFQNYDRYPDEDFRRSRIEAVERAMTHLRELQRG